MTREAGWAVLAAPPAAAPDVRWWAGRAQQVRLAIDSLEAFRAQRCRCPRVRADWRNRLVPCEAPAGLPHRYVGVFLTPVEPPRRPTLASLGLVSPHTVTGALRGPIVRAGGPRATTPR